MAAPDIVPKLVDQFARHRESYQASQYHETQLRQEFLNPFFKALGWDVDNEQGNAEAYKDVIHEDAIKVGGATKAPDYCFRIGGRRIFFLEAKKPSVNVRDDVSAAFQLRRYAWSAKLPLSILSDFEELAVYDCRIKPDKSDKPSVGRVLFLNCDEYVERWDELAGIFSREAVLKGSFDKYAEGTKLKRGTAEVDAAFLEEIESWRDVLARHFALRNPDLSQRDLNFAVQRTIDRVIFLRMCEDRGVESYGQLAGLVNGERTYARLQQLFDRADERYNSGLFHFQPEKGRAEPPDELTPSLVLDDKPLKDILRGLYYPDSPYEFSVLPAEILGQVYEQFLGKVIKLTAGHRAVVEDKPEVKKAGGVYYTPAYIVDYIVRNTVGKLVKGKTPKEAAKLRVLDPACGSGSFLVGAFQFLLDWHRDWYVKDGVKKHTKQVYQGPGGQWFLTTAEKKRILLNNIHGVDIDSQAVEVTKLSLLLKVLEHENRETLDRQLRLLHERALPDLGNNIKCGNSLIGPDFYNGQQMSLLDDEEQYRINVFDWKAEFPAVFKGKDGGFDAVIGNPPYIFTRNKGIDEAQKAYFYSHYKHQSSQLNTFAIFCERSCSLLHTTGVLGFITPNNWLTIDSFAPLRRFILDGAGDVKVVNILDRVFSAHVDTAITVLRKGQPAKLVVAEMRDRSETFCNDVQRGAVQPPAYIVQISLLKDRASADVLERVEANADALSQFCTVSTGLKAYQIGKGKPRQTKREKEGRVFHSNTRPNSTYHKYLEGADVSRYCLTWSGEYLSYGDWLAERRKSVPFTGERLLIRQIPAKPPYLVHAVYTDEEYYHDINSMVVFCPLPGLSLKFLLGLINSRLLSFWFQRTYDKLQRKIFPQFKVKELGSFPIRGLDLSQKPDRLQHDRIVQHVDAILAINRQLSVSKNPGQTTHLKRRLTTLDRQVDRTVYELYGLTDEEIALVEAASE